MRCCFQSAFYPLGIIEITGINLYVVGDELNITCVTGPSDLPVVWHKRVVTGSGENYVEISTGDPRVSFEPTGSRSTLRISNLMNGDEGEYRCSGAAPPFDNVNATFDVLLLPGLFVLYSLSVQVIIVCIYRQSWYSGEQQW